MRDVGGPIEGVHSTVFRVACADGQGFAVKVFAEECRSFLEKERSVLALAESPALRVPRVVGSDESRELLPWAYLLLTDLGEVLERDQEDAMSRAQLLRFNRELGMGLRALHERRLERFGAITGQSQSDHADNTSFMLASFDVALNRFSELGGSERLEWRARDHVLARSHLFADCRQAVLCHLDCHQTNIAVTIGEDGPVFAGLLDFGSAVAGDPLLDLAKTHYVARRASPDTLAALLGGYRDLPPDWQPVFSLYTLFHAFAGWNWFAECGYRDCLPPLERDIRRITGGPWRGGPRGFRDLR